MQLEDDLSKGDVVWYCLEVEQEDEKEDVLIVVARLSYQTAEDDNSKVATVDSIFFSDGLYSASASVSLLKSFLTQLETTAFHMQAAKLAVEVERDHTTFLTLLESAGYTECGGYFVDSTQCMVVKHMRMLNANTSTLNVMGAETKGANDAVEDQFEIVSSVDDAMASLMPDLFAALHREYGTDK
ncbi:hypothetical protein EON65_39915 [archaeon]|nr:MAG: hypothetical protein EON65_39915 [archaeon]